MVEQNATKLNQLERNLPEGLVVDAAWLEARGYASNLRSYYVKTGWLAQPARGVYSRGGYFRRRQQKLDWQQVVISLQTILNYSPLIVGGSTALMLHGLTHYVSQGVSEVHLYGPKAPPAWVDKLGLAQRFIHHNNRKIFANDPITQGLGSLAWDIHAGRGRDLSRLQGGGVTEMAWKESEWPLTLSTPERAILEWLDDLPDRASFHNVDKVMEGLAGLSPRRLQKLLVDCRSIKVKRLFFFFADRHQHAWLKRLDKTAIVLGKGKRVLFKGGRLDPVYLITVPGHLDGDQ